MTGRRSQIRAGSSPRWTAPPFRMALISICIDSFVTNDGQWVVVQQGMNGDRKQARRYHWLSEGLKSFVEEPHSAIDGVGQGEIINLTDRRAEASRRGQLDVLQSLGPDGIARELSALEHRAGGARHTNRSEAALSAAFGHAGPSRRPPKRRADAAPLRQPGRSGGSRRLPTSPNCCSFQASARGPCARWRWSPRSCTVRRTASPTRRASRLRTVARTGIRFRCPFGFTIRQFKC